MTGGHHGHDRIAGPLVPLVVVLLIWRRMPLGWRRRCRRDWLWGPARHLAAAFQVNGRCRIQTKALPKWALTLLDMIHEIVSQLVPNLTEACRGQPARLSWQAPSHEITTGVRCGCTEGGPCIVASFRSPALESTR